MPRIEKNDTGSVTALFLCLPVNGAVRAGADKKKRKQIGRGKRKCETGAVCAREILTTSWSVVNRSHAAKQNINSWRYKPANRMVWEAHKFASIASLFACLSLSFFPLYYLRPLLSNVLVRVIALTYISKGPFLQN